MRTETIVHSFSNLQCNMNLTNDTKSNIAHRVIGIYVAASFATSTIFVFSVISQCPDTWLCNDYIAIIYNDNATDI